MDEEVVVLQYNRLSHEHVYLIQRDLPELTAADAKTRAKEIEASMAKEWASWNAHEAFKPILRNKAKNIIDARWLHKWKIVEGKKAIKSRMCVCAVLKTSKETKLPHQLPLQPR